METTTDSTVVATPAPAGARTSAVSWAAILGGTIAATSMTLILFVLGTGLGLTSVSPWSREGLDAEGFGIAAILWITFTSLASAALGGYLAGRLRTRWPDAMRDEVFFRDTAHGFMTWGLSTLLMALLFASVTGSIASAGARAVSSVAGGVGSAAASVAGAAGGGLLAAGGGRLASRDGDDIADTIDYYVDMLFRRDPGAMMDMSAAGAGTAPNQPAVAANPGDPVAQGPTGDGDTPPEQGQEPQPQVQVQAVNPQSNTQRQPLTRNVSNAERAPRLPSLDEVSRIVSRAWRGDGLGDGDVQYLGRQIAYYAGIDQMQAETRVRETFEELRGNLQELETAAREAADEARATAARVSLWSFIALLAGAFIGSLSATWGGRQRDL